MLGCDCNYKVLIVLNGEVLGEGGPPGRGLLETSVVRVAIKKGVDFYTGFDKGCGFRLKFT